MKGNTIVSISMQTLDEALHWENHAALTLKRIQSNPIEGQENLQMSLIRMWSNVHRQARHAAGYYSEERQNVKGL